MCDERVFCVLVCVFEVWEVDGFWGGRRIFWFVVLGVIECVFVLISFIVDEVGLVICCDFFGGGSGGNWLWD